MDTEKQTEAQIEHSRLGDNASEMQAVSNGSLSPVDNRRLLLRADCAVLSIMTITMTLSALDKVSDSGFTLISVSHGKIIGHVPERARICCRFQSQDRRRSKRTGILLVTLIHLIFLFDMFLYLYQRWPHYGPFIYLAPLNSDPAFLLT